MTRITFIDTIVMASQRLQPRWEAWLLLLFHQCVHVCQYKLLGIETFIEQYVQGWGGERHQLPCHSPRSAGVPASKCL